MNNYQSIIISDNLTLLDALKKMDQEHHKLLIVLSNEKYSNLVSIGDIQRALIAGFDISTTLKSIPIDEKKVVRSGTEKIDVKKLMLNIRSEFMPVLDNNGRLENVIFWEDLFGDKRRIQENQLNLPVVIMAGGKGSRLKPISNVIPKPLIPIGEKTIVENIMDRFIDAGCSEFYFSVNYKKDMITHYFKSKNEYKIKFFSEPTPLGTAGSLSLLRDEIRSSFFVSNCDILIDQELVELYNYHKKNENEITLVAALKHIKIPYGTIESGENGVLKKMDEKPELTFMINAGMYILEPHLLKEIPDNTFFHITELIENIKYRNGRVGVFPISENSWVDIGEWPEYINTVRSISNDSDFFMGI